MSESSGRAILVERSTDGGTTYSTIASVRSKTFTFNDEKIDITTDDSNAFRTLLADSANKSLDISASGVLKDATIFAEIVGSGGLQDLRLTINDLGTVTGSFAISSFGITGEYQDAATFESEFQSSGTYTYTAP